MPLRDIEKRLDARVDPRIRCMAVKLKRQGRLVSHFVAKKAKHKGVRAAAKVSNKAAKDVGHVFNLLCSFEDTLTCSPVHTGHSRLTVGIEAIKGQCQDAARSKLARDSHIGHGRERIVCSPK